ELFFKVHYIVGDIQVSRHSPCIVHGAQAAAAPVFFLLQRILILPDLHGDADHIISLFFQQPGGDRRVHAARHSHDHSAHQYSSSSSSSPSWTSDFGFSSPSILIPFFSA